MQETRQTGDIDGQGGRANMHIVFLCLFMVTGMGGLAYASVPLYELFCRVTGYGGTTQRAVNSEGIQVLDREITVRFDSNVAPALGWKFYPEQREVKLRIGEVREINYFVENNSDQVLTGTATFNVTPQSAGAYFNKLACFCFTETRVEPGEMLKMPVVFFVDPEIVNTKETANLHALTLSYTFFPARNVVDPLAESKPAGASDPENRS